MVQYVILLIIFEYWGQNVLANYNWIENQYFVVVGTFVFGDNDNENIIWKLYDNSIKEYIIM